MRKVIMGAVCLALILTGCNGKKEDAANNATEVTVTTEKARVETISAYNSYTGNVKPSTEIVVTPKVSGKIIRDNASSGQSVSAGDVLFAIDDTDVRLQVQQAQASYNSAKANYDRTVGGSAQQSITQLEQEMQRAQIELGDANSNYDKAKASYDGNITLNQAQITVDDAQSSYDRAVEMFESNSAVAAAQNEYDSAVSNFERTQELYKIGAIAQTQYENAQNRVNTAEAQLHSAKLTAQQNVDSAKARLDGAKEQYKSAEINATTQLEAAQTRLKNAQAAYNSVQQNLNLTKNVINPENQKSAKATVDQAKAALDLSNQLLKDMVITAPISGEISSENVNVGEIAGPAATKITIVNLNAVTIEIKVSENSINSINEGTTAIIEVVSAGISDIQGVVGTVSSTADSSGMYLAKIYVDNTSGLLKGGMLADVKLATSIAESSVVIPAEAVMKEQGESFVYVANGTTPEKRIIKTGVQNDALLQVTQGVSEGEDVVVKGKDYIKEGSVLKIN